jgi:hypothetical protein
MSEHPFVPSRQNTKAHASEDKPCSGNWDSEFDF